MGGGMEANKNRFIEDWSSARENLEHNFRWTRRNFALVGLFGIAIPVLVYKGIVREFVGHTGSSCECLTAMLDNKCRRVKTGCSLGQQT
ncbi:hypothetical protein QQP08_019010, partial [Theobroma cacao]